MKILCIGLMILNSLPLLLYPFVLMANLMSLAALSSAASNPGWEQTTGAVFMILSTIFPLAWLVGLVVSIVMLVQQRPRPALIAQIVVAACLLMVVGFAFAWGDAGSF